MIWKTNTHQFTATVCQRTGKTCPALAQAARAMVQAVATASPVTTEAFEVEGSAELTHCPQGCTARFHARPDRVRIYCVTDPDTQSGRLDNYAELMFGAAFSTLPADTMENPPCAMLQAERLAPQQPALAEAAVPA